MQKSGILAKLNGLVSHEAWASLIGMVYLGLIVNLLLVVSCLPLVALLVTTDPLYSWPLLALAVPLAAPGLAAAFRAFREHGTSVRAGGGLGPIRAFVAGLRETWWRALVIGAMVTAVIVVLLVDVRMLSNTAAAVVTVPLLAVLALLAVAVGLVSLVAVAEVPTARLRDVLRASLYLGLRRWYLTAVSLAVLAVQIAVFATAPALGLGLTASAALYLAWTNSRVTLRPVLELDEKATAQA